MEIKVGDKVRVREDAPIHIIGSASEIKCKAVVLGTDADIAVIGFRTQERQRYDAYKVPTKYLIKVEDEAKEPKPKYKAGDKVRVLGHALLEGCVFTITLVEHREKRGWMYRINTHTWFPESDLEPYTEPTAPTIKVGDFVRVLENLHEPICLDVERHLEITNVPPHAVSQKKWKVISIEVRRDCAGRIYTLKHDDSFIYNIPEDCVELVQPNEQTEGKEPKFHIGDIVSYEGISGSMRSGRVVSERSHFNLYTVCSGIDFFSVEEEALNLYNPIKDGYISPIESEPCNTDDTDWDAYTADLAKEIAVKIVNRNMDSDPKEAADYAVSVAKAVVENLKKK